MSNRFAPMEGISSNRPIIMIFPTGDTIIIEEGSAVLSMETEHWDGYDAIIHYGRTFIDLKCSDINTFKVLKGGAKAYLRYKEKERRSNLKKKGGRNHVSR